MEFLSALGLLAVLILVLVLAYFTTRWVGKHYGGGGIAGGASGSIRVVDKLMLGPDRMLCIVQTAGKTLLLGITQQRIEMLCELDEAALTFPERGTVPSFADMFKTVLEKTKNGKADGKKGDEEDPYEEN